MAADEPESIPAPETGRAIREVSELLGVPAPTLRSWERRYGIPATGRSDGGHRRYSPRATHELRLMRDEVARGRKASEAARVVKAMLDPSRAHAPLIERLLSASRELDPAAVRAQLEEARHELGLAVTLDEVLMPTMRQVGNLWASGRCDEAQEHLTTEAARGWLAWVTSVAPPALPGRPVVLACGPRDLHTLGIEALAALLAHGRRSCRVLGARTPARTLVTAITATDAAAAVVVAHLSAQRRAAAEALSLASTTGVPVFYGGNAFSTPLARVGVAGTYLGDHLGDAADRLLAMTQA